MLRRALAFLKPRTPLGGFTENPTMFKLNKREGRSTVLPKRSSSTSRAPKKVQKPAVPRLVPDELRRRVGARREGAAETELAVSPPPSQPRLSAAKKVAAAAAAAVAAKGRVAASERSGLVATDAPAAELLNADGKRSTAVAAARIAAATADDPVGKLDAVVEYALIEEKNEPDVFLRPRARTSAAVGALVAMHRRSGGDEDETRHVPVRPQSTVFGSDLDALEREYNTARREALAASRAMDLPGVFQPSPAADPRIDDVRPPPTRLIQRDAADLSVDDSPAAENPHFADEGDFVDDGEGAGSASGGELVERVVDGGGAPAAGVEDGRHFDAYHRRPNDMRRRVPLPPEHWLDGENRRRLDAAVRAEDEAASDEVTAEGVLDAVRPHHALDMVRRANLIHLGLHPKNEMIQEAWVIVRQLYPADGSEPIDFTTAESGPGVNDVGGSRDFEMPVAHGRAVAREHGLDLIKVGEYSYAAPVPRHVAICIIADAREHLRRAVSFFTQRAGITVPQTEECVEVPFRGGTMPHAVRTKAIGIVKHLLHSRPVRINMTDFGTPREGIASLQSIFDEVRAQAVRMRAFHTATRPQVSYNEIWCFLVPSTPRAPKSEVRHPSPAELERICELRTLQMDKETVFDLVEDAKTARERLTILTSIEDGTAWAYRDDGLSLQRQRAIKVMSGMLPKGNHKIYALRGDVNVTHPFRASHATSTDRWAYPRESNLEQAERASALLGRRRDMGVSDMYDQGETPDAPSVVERFHYRVSGPALEVGELKTALGLKTNMRKLPALANGFATLGANHGPQEDAPLAAIK